MEVKVEAEEVVWSSRLAEQEGKNREGGMRGWK